MAIARSAFEQAKRSPDHMAALIEYSSREAGQQRIDSWLREQGLYNKVLVGVVAVWNDFDMNQLDAWAKVVVPGAGSFEHSELYIAFPSDHFKTKILMVTGGA